jgi:uncharacterized membrane protein
LTIGPVQLVVLGFEEPNFQGEILEELARLRASDVVRVVDALAVMKDHAGLVTALEWSDLSGEDAAEFGATVGALVGLGAGGAEGAEAGAILGAAAAAEGETLFGDIDVEELITEIPEGTAAALVMLEHRWAIPLREAIRRAGGFDVADAWVHPRDLVAVGLLAAAEADELLGEEES